MKSENNSSPHIPRWRSKVCDRFEVIFFYISFAAFVLQILKFFGWIIEIWICNYSGLLHHLQGFMHPRWCRISSINSISSKIDFKNAPLPRRESLFLRRWRVQHRISMHSCHCRCGCQVPGRSVYRDSATSMQIHTKCHLWKLLLRNPCYGDVVRWNFLGAMFFLYLVLNFENIRLFTEMDQRYSLLTNNNRRQIINLKALHNHATKRVDVTDDQRNKFSTFGVRGPCQTVPLIAIHWIVEADTPRCFRKDLQWCPEIDGVFLNGVPFKQAMIPWEEIVKDVMFPRQSFPLHLGVIFIWTMRLIGGWEERPKVEISIRIWGDSEIVFGRWFLSIFLRGVQHKAMVEAFQCTLQSLDDLVEACHAFNGSS